MPAKKKTEKIDDININPLVAEAVRRAMALYELLLRHTNNGGKVILQDKTGYQKELVVR